MVEARYLADRQWFAKTRTPDRLRRLYGLEFGLGPLNNYDLMSDCRG